MTPSDASLRVLYGDGPDELALHRQRYDALFQRFRAQYPPSGEPLRFFSAPGRAEIGGNHTDHQRGRVLAASIDLDTIAAVRQNDDRTIRVLSEGYPYFEVDLADLSARESERGTSAAIIRGCASRMHALNRPIGGFDATVSSRVFGGSGLSSSAAFEVLTCTILDTLYGGAALTSTERAKIAQYAENVYFGKPSGLLDQMASATGGIVTIDFARDEPDVSAIRYDFLAKGYRMVVVNTGGSHDDLTDAYADIRREMERVAAFFGQKNLRGADPAAFEAAIPALRRDVSDRALLRAFHFFDENDRVVQMVNALMDNDLDTFWQLITTSGDSSWELLQNVWASPQEQPLALAMELSRRFLRGRGAYRVHGGGFAGTILAFVPTDMYDAYARRMDAVFGEGACCPLRVRDVGGYELQSEVETCY